MTKIKDKDVIKTFKNIVKKSPTTDDAAIKMLDYFLPLSNGNLLKNVVERIAIDNVFNEIDREDDDKTWSLKLWIYFLQEAKYWQNLFPIANENKLLESKADILDSIYLLISTVWVFGTCGVYKDKSGALIPMILVGDFKSDPNGNIVEADGIYAGSNLAWGKIDLDNQTGKVNTNKRTDLKNGKKFALNKNNCVFFKSNTWKIPAFLIYWDFICGIDSLKTTADNLARLTSITMLYYSKNTTTSKEEIKHLSKTRSGVAYIHGTSDELKNKLENFDTQAAQSLIALTEYVTFYKQFFYTYIGRRFNINEKAERNIDSEVQFSQYNFDVLENEFFKNLKIGFSKLKEKFGIDIQLARKYVYKENEKQEENDNDTEI